MTELLQQTVEQILKLPEDQQDGIALFIQQNFLGEDPIVFLNPNEFLRLNITQKSINQFGEELGLK